MLYRRFRLVLHLQLIALNSQSKQTAIQVAEAQEGASPEKEFKFNQMLALDLRLRDKTGQTWCEMLGVAFLCVS